MCRPTCHLAALAIFNRYENFGLGDALAAKEPLTSLARVKLETFVQGYEDKLSQGKSAPPPADR